MTLLKKSKTAVSAIAIITLIALAIVGFAYAHWSETLWLQGTVNTAEIKVKCMSASSDDPPGTIDVGKDKDVGTALVSIIDDTHINVTIVNGYPCYETYVHFTVKNVGTIPIHFRGFGPQPPFAYNLTSGHWEATLFDGDITVHGWNGIDEQLHPGWTRDYTIWIHIEQSAEQGATYTFTVEVIFSQWNAND